MKSLELPFRDARRLVCQVRVGVGALDQLVADLAAAPPGRPLVVVADDRVGRLYGQSLVDRLSGKSLVAHLVTFPEGEAHKTRETKASIEDRLLAHGVGRDGAVVALGGGVTGDLAGFVAATWCRGIPVVQVPTTLLAMVDAAIGGKTGVDLPGGKNLVGCFHQPWGVYADLETLATLDRRRYVDGFAEVVKIAAVADARLFAALERDVPQLVGASLQARQTLELLEPLVAQAMALKGRIVAGDPLERGRRAALNFGHTVGHALETATGYALSHGRAVALGMAVEADLACALTRFPQSHRRRLTALLDACGFSLELPEGLDVGNALAAARRDKKNLAGEVRCALPRRLGSMPADVTTVVSQAVLEQRIRDGDRTKPGLKASRD